MKYLNKQLVLSSKSLKMLLLFGMNFEKNSVLPEVICAPFFHQLKQCLVEIFFYKILKIFIYVIHFSKKVKLLSKLWSWSYSNTCSFQSQFYFPKGFYFLLYQDVCTAHFSFILTGIMNKAIND